MASYIILHFMQLSNMPPSLLNIQNPPKNFYVRGVLPDFQRPWIAIVGTRKATSEGMRLAKNFSRELAEAGAVIVSGLALGVDSAAHQGALEVAGATVAVLANGIDKIYPAQNENLAKKILETGGALVSEYPEKTPALPHQFLERNRIISGLSIATVVIEAPEKSGALATAGFAAAQGREVFVVPGPAGHPNYRGSHGLIRDGARLAASAADILEDLGLQTIKEKKTASLPLAENEAQRKIMDSLKKSGRPLRIDEIICLAKLEPQVVNRELALLALRGAVQETEKGYSI
jgi:DNA processing protein